MQLAAIGAGPGRVADAAPARAEAVQLAIEGRPAGSAAAASEGTANGRQLQQGGHIDTVLRELDMLCRRKLSN